MPKIIIPEDFICPITLELIKEPVTIEGDDSGQLYEEEAIKEHFITKNTIPHTNGMALSKKIKVNVFAKRKIKEFLTQMDICSPAAFFKAIEEGDCSVLQNLNYTENYLESKDTENNTPLHIAIKKGHVEIIELLLDKKNEDAFSLKRRVNIKGKQNHTPLHVAAERGLVEIVRQLLAYGADIEAQAYYDGILCSPLYLSVIHHHHETAELLLKQKATVKLAKSSMLHLAIKKDNGKMFELLLNYGADQEAINEYGQTPLYLAASLGKAYFIDKLIQSGANIERAAYGKFSRGPRPLHIAVYHRHLDAVALLVKAGASLIDDWNYDYNKYATATVLACEKGYAEIVELLIKHESQVKDIWLNKAIENIHPEIVQVLLSTGLANYLKTRTWERTTFLHVAVSVKRSYPQSESVIQIVKMLLDVGAHLESTDSEGNTALHLAAKSNNMAIVQLLIQKGAFTQALNRWGQTPLQAASTETGRMIKSLLDHIELENKMNNPKLIELEKIINQQKNEIELLKEEMNAIKQKLGMDKTSYESLKDNPPTTTLFFK